MDRNKFLAVLQDEVGMFNSFHEELEYITFVIRVLL